jgi:hypothetical protein
MRFTSTYVTTELRAKLYDLAAITTDIYILYDRPWGRDHKAGPDLHYLEIISDKLEPHQKGRHVNTILDERGLRFKLDCDV